MPTMEFSATSLSSGKRPKKKLYCGTFVREGSLNYIVYSEV